VIDQIDDDPDDPTDVAGPGPSWADCPILLCGDMLAVIERHKDLDGRAVNLFRNALKGQPRSDLLEPLSQAAPLPSRLALHLHDPGPERV
jgi:hypothetical protein